MVNLYLDGCSFTWGTGLDSKDTLYSKFEKAGYNVLNFSRPGKSNSAIAQDTYNNIDSADIFILGFTFSARYHLKFDNIDIDLLPSNYNWQYDFIKWQGNSMNDVVNNLHKNFYTLFDHTYWNKFSDMLVDNTINSLTLRNKKIFVFSWEKRNTKNKILYPIIPDRLSDGHLNTIGTKKLFDMIQNQLGNP